MELIDVDALCQFRYQDPSKRGGQGGAMRGFASFITICALLFATCSCALSSSRQSRLDRATALLNSRDYQGALAILEQERVDAPNDPKVSFLLAQAHLGL